MNTFLARKVLWAVLALAFVQPLPLLAESHSPVPSSVAGAIETRLAVGKTKLAALRAFYEGRQFAPFWLGEAGGASPNASALLAWLAEADGQALPARRDELAELRARVEAVAAAEPAARAALEIALTRRFLDQARTVSSGLLEPRRVDIRINIPVTRPEPAELLTRLATTGDVAAFLASLEPASDEYAELRSVYAELRTIAREGGWGPQVPAGKALHPGDRDPRVRDLRARLLTLGDLPGSELVAAAATMTDAPAADGDPFVYDAALEAAVRRFQLRHGLNDDGIVGPATLAALNTTAAERARQVAVNLERLRWFNRPLGERYVMINTAAFMMSLIENGRPVFSTRTVVGKAGRFQTPEFIDELEFMVVNPKWNVPRSIATREILPILKKNPDYLAENNMVLVDADGPMSTIDWSQVTPATFPGRIVQMPGPGNALGSVKFLFPNEYSIYMHDTPAKRLFTRDRRDFSHGCVRLQDPVGFAHLLLSYEGREPETTFDRLRAASGEKWLRLKNRIPVYVTYRTAWVAEDGTWNFRADVYGRDRKVWAALEKAGVRLFEG